MNPLGIDLLVPKCEEPWGADAIAREASDNTKGAYTCTSCSEEG